MEGRNETLVVMMPNVDATYNAGIGGWLDPNGYQTFLTDALLYSSIIDLSGWTMEKLANMGIKAPGMLGTGQDFSTIIYGNYRLYVPNASLGAFPGFLQLLSSTSFGSKEPTASENLYFYRLVKCAGAAPDTLTLPACRIGLFGTFYHEDEKAYMMRLKRSYELQQLVD